jgi:thioredoxin reductase (NADPH)
MEKVVIIGSGCAGLTAALYTARANLAPLGAEGRHQGTADHDDCGLIYSVFGGVDGYELMSRMQKQAERLGRDCSFDTVEARGLSHSRSR